MIRRLTRWLTDAALADAIAGDLVEERRRRAARSQAWAMLWYWRAALGIALYLLVTRLGAAAGAAATAPFRRGPGPIGQTRHAVRSLRKAPWYATAVIGVIALDMALATTVFAVVDGVLFKPLPYPRAGELVSVEAGFRDTAVTGRPMRISAADVAAWSAAMPDVQFTGFRIDSNARFEDVNDAPLGVAAIQPNFFDVIGVRPLLGGFTPDHYTGQPGSGATMISYGLWQTRFGAAPDIVGRRIVRGTASMEIVGVMPRGFVFPSSVNAQVLMPLTLPADQRTSPRARQLDVLARLPPRISPNAATSRLEGVMAVNAPSFPPLPPPPPGTRIANNFGPFDRAVLHPLDERLAARSRPLFLAVFLSAAALVVLGCVNVSGLMAARGLDRSREIALRRALGAGGGHIAALVLAEAAVLAGLGTLTGLALARPLLDVALAVLPVDLTLLKTPAVDWRVAAFAAVVTAVSVLGVSLWPIRRGLHASGDGILKDGERSGTRARSLGRFVVVSVQVAIGLALTLGGALLVGSLVRLWQDDIGMTPGGVFAIELRVPASTLDADPTAFDAIPTRILDRIRALPDVTAAGGTDASLFRNTTFGDLGLKTPAGAARRVSLSFHGITSGFFDVVRPRLIAGRLPSNQDIDAGRNLLVVSESVAKAYWPAASAVGQEVEFTRDTPKRFSVIGVVADARFSSWDALTQFPVYMPFRALARGWPPSLLIRTTAPPGRILNDVQAFMAAEGPDVRAIRAMTLDDMLADTVRPRRFQSWLFGSFAVAALAIVGVGMLGLMAMATARRTREIGIRMALGATTDGVVRLLVREQMAPVIAGLVAGGAISAWAVTFVKSYLYELTVYDGRIWAAAVLLILGTAVLGMLIPSLRASRLNPVHALRVE